MQHSIVERSSQWMSVMPPASPVALMSSANSPADASKVGMRMKSFMLLWPPATARRSRRRAGGVSDDRVEEDVGDRLLRDSRRFSAHALGDRLPRQDVGHVAEGRDTAGQRGLGAARVVVDPIRFAGVDLFDVEVDVRIDAPRQHEPAVGVELAGAGHRAADLNDAPAGDAHVGPLSPVGVHDRPPTQNQVEQGLRHQ